MNNSVGAAWSYDYDALGNLDGKYEGNVLTYDYTFDGEGRLASVRTSNQPTTFTYDADGNRVRVLYPDGGGDIYTPFPDVDMAIAGGETTWRITFNANGQPAAQWVKADETVTLYSLHTNHLGSVVAVGNAGGIVANNHALYEPFGAKRTVP